MIPIILLVGFLFLGWDAPRIMGQEEVSISGVTEAIKDVTLSLSVAGTVSAIFVKEGSTVKRGQIILELDKKLEELEVARRKLIWESKTELVAAKARVLTMKSKLESTQKLFETTRSVSREELEEKELEHKLAVAEKDQLEIEEQRQRIEYEMALETLKKRRLVSPISGIVIKLFLDKGESSEPEQPLVHVVDTSRCLLVSNMEEPLGRTLKKGQAVTMSIRTGSKSITKKGTVAFVSPIVDPASGLLEVKAAFSNQDGAVRPGVEGFMLLSAP
jgi:RND family efflux transporter MFP subunit